MNLLVIEHVNKRLGDGARTRTVLRDVSLELGRGEYAVVWGPRGSGRSTLLRIAAGVQTPDSGAVRFEGRPVGGAGAELGAGIGYCHMHFLPGEGRRALDLVMTGLLAGGYGAADARGRANRALERCELSGRTRAPLHELDRAEQVRLALARALVHSPRLLIVDEPTYGVELMQRDAILLLLRSLADDGIAVLASTAEPAGLAGADRTLALGDGVLRGELEPELATVVPLRGRSQHAAAG